MRKFKVVIAKKVDMDVDLLMPITHRRLDGDIGIEKVKRKEYIVCVHTFEQVELKDVVACFSEYMNVESIKEITIEDYRVKMDGNKHCLEDHNFTNLQESLAGFGDSPEEALEDLFKQK